MPEPTPLLVPKPWWESWTLRFNAALSLPLIVAVVDYLAGSNYLAAYREPLIFLAGLLAVIGNPALRTMVTKRPLSLTDERPEDPITGKKYYPDAPPKTQ